MQQIFAWQLTLLLTFALVAVFVFVVLNAGRKEEYGPIKERGYRLRTRFFWVLLLVATPTVGYTLLDLPYKAAERAGAEALQVDAVGYQWYWTLSQDEARVGQPVVFNVTSEDVNHGFAIYDEDMQLVAQTQAMPGYRNRLMHVFERPGTYRILCLEYCGVAHHDMDAEFRVLDDNQ